MSEKSKLNKLLDNSKFSEAVSLLKDHLAKAEIIDPSNDGSWAPYADEISSKILAVKEQEAFTTFWEELLKFFEGVLELTWGHLHKGHIFFRLGLASLVANVSTGKQYLEKGLDEDRLLEEKRAQARSFDIETAVRKYSAYVMLCIIERIEDEHFDSQPEKQKFFQELISPSFDAAIMGQEVRPELVQRAIRAIVPEQALEQTLETRKELDWASAQRLPIATVSLAGVFLENVILYILYYQRNVRTVNGQSILEVELGKLIREAFNRTVFPSNTIRATSKLIHIFRNRLHPGNEFRQTYKLTSRVAVTLKILLDLALLEWANQIASQKDA